MTDHPITPPPELVQALLHGFHNGESLEATLARGFQAGADQELEACCHEVQNMYSGGSRLRAARRPKPPTQKELALKTLKCLESESPFEEPRFETIRRALEALPDD